MTTLKNSKGGQFPGGNISEGSIAEVEAAGGGYCVNY